MAIANPRDLNLMLIGRTGHGKSATGNSILARYQFNESPNGDSETPIFSEGWTERDGYVVKVVDTPGFHDTRLGRLDDVKAACRNLSQAILSCPEGFHALLLVLEFGQKLTEEERSAIDMLKSLLGKSVVSDYCVCVITHGDDFSKVMRRIRSNETFEEWCRNQRGGLGDIFMECSYRCVLFENLSEDATVQMNQVQELLGLVDKLKCREIRYTSHHFEQAVEERNKLVVATKEPLLKESMMKKTSLLLDALHQLFDRSETSEQVEVELTALEAKVEDLLTEISEEDMGTGVLDSLRDVVKPIQDNIQEHKNMLQVSQLEIEAGRERQKAYVATLRELGNNVQTEYDSRLQRPWVLQMVNDAIDGYVNFLVRIYRFFTRLAS